VIASDDWALLDRTFHERFGAGPAFRVEAPGRVNLIGEHTDYNEGLVLPAAINRYVRVAAGPTGAPVIRFYSVHFAEETVLSVDRPDSNGVPRWGRYFQGVAAGLQRAGVRLRGTDGVVGGDLPIGSGLSSSAAIEVAAALTLLHAAGAAQARRDTALLAQRAEVEFVGVRCGIMDQFTVALARPGHALFLDCRTLEVDHVPLPPSIVPVVCDTGVRRSLASSAYNERRRECARAVEGLQRLRSGIRALRDLAPEDLPLVERLPDPLRRRARHVITENKRVLDTVAALRREQLDTVGRLLGASHASLRDDYEVSVPALEAMVSAAEGAPGCLGARLTGAGFGGAVLALVERAAVPAFVAKAASAYQSAVGRQGALMVCEVVGGAGVK
jgi:galactokinase